jgi:hypothetical protein
VGCPINNSYAVFFLHVRFKPTFSFMQAVKWLRKLFAGINKFGPTKGSIDLALQGFDSGLKVARSVWRGSVVLGGWLTVDTCVGIISIIGDCS